MDRPELAYLVCATPRSGSTLLCKALAATGVAGVPEEYFEARPATGRPPAPADYFAGATGIDLDDLLGPDAPGPPAPPYSSLAGIDDYADHLRRSIAAGTTPNGVFAAKVMWGHLPDLAELAGGRPPALFESLFGPPRYVRVARRDRVRQAVSLWKAIQTQSWSAADGAGERPAHYSFAAIDHLRRGLDADERGWDGFFDENGIVPLVLDYEDVAGDLGGAVRAVLEHLGLDPLPAAAVRPPLERQADERSEDWARRYRHDASEVTA